MEYYMSGFTHVPTLQMQNGARVIGAGQILQYLKDRAGVR